MNLVLWRHADAVEGYPDHERALTEKGRQQAKRMAAWLNERLPPDARILVSPALRAQQTASALKREFTTCDALHTSTNYAAVFKALGPRTHDGATLLVGHQPTLGELASFLLTGEAGALNVKKAAVWWFDLNDAPGVRAVLRAVMTPGML
jgi:phosphohistidine phosphatase